MSDYLCINMKVLCMCSKMTINSLIIARTAKKFGQMINNWGSDLFWRLWLKGNFIKLGEWEFTKYTSCIHKYIPKCLTLKRKWWDTENGWFLTFSLSVPAILLSKKHVCASGWRGEFRLKGHLSNHDWGRKTRIHFKNILNRLGLCFHCISFVFTDREQKASFTGEYSAPEFKDCKCRNIKKWQNRMFWWIYLFTIVFLITMAVFQDIRHCSCYIWHCMQA